jgi:hypothetical protein
MLVVGKGGLPPLRPGLLISKTESGGKPPFPTTSMPKNLANPSLTHPSNATQVTHHASRITIHASL